MHHKVSGKCSIICRIILVIALLAGLCPTELFVRAEDQVIDISCVQDLLEAQEYLKNHSGYVVFNQTCDIQISPYNYIYRKETHRIEIRYGEETEVYYDVKDGRYYDSVVATGAAVSYDWRVSSWTPLGSGSVSGSYGYRGNGHTIEGIYQKKMSKNKVTDTGVFYGAVGIQGVTIKNYFGLGMNLDTLSILGNDICESRDCGADNAQLITDNDSVATDAGFVGRLTTRIRGARVNANLFTVNTSSQAGDNQYYRGNNLGILIGKVAKGGVAENCHTSGIIGIGGDEAYAAGGIAGWMEEPGTGPSRIRNCTSDAVIDGHFFAAGGIVGVGLSGDIAIENCRFRGKMMRPEVSYADNTGYGYSGGICGYQESGVIQGCVNEGIVQGYYGYYGGITGNLEGGEIIHCVNEGTVAGGGAPTIMFGDAVIHEEGDFLAGGIAGYVYLPVGMFQKGISIINCGNRGNVSSKSGPAAGIAAYQKGSATEIVNVWNTGQVEGTLDADSVTGTWISGSRENCLDGRESTPEELCEKLNQWIASADMEEHFTLEGFDKLYLWKVENGSLELVIPEKPEVSSEPEVTPEPIIMEPTEQPSASDIYTPEPTGNAGVGESPSPEQPGNDATEEPLLTPSPEQPGNDEPEEPSLTPSSEQPGTDESEEPSPAPTKEPSGRDAAASPSIPSGDDRQEGQQAQASDIADGSAGAADSTPQTPVQTTAPAKAKATAKPQTVKSKEATKSREKAAGNKAARRKAPVFTLSRRKSVAGQSYILVKVGKHQGDYVEVWAKLGKSRYTKLKLSQNRLSVLKNKLKFKYTFSGKKLYFQLRTYDVQKGKKVYSEKSRAKGIVTK